MSDLTDQFGSIDIYLFDQLLKGRIAPGMRVLDVGCGSGRNLVYMLRSGYDVYGVDADADSIDAVRELAAELAPSVPQDHFQVARIEALPFADALADVVICNAALHFARDDAHFDAMLRESWRMLKPGGLFFARLASSIGLEVRPRQIEGRRFQLPDGSTRYLVDEAMLLEWTKRLGGALADPIKTTNVQNLRCMTTWVVRRGAAE